MLSALRVLIDLLSAENHLDDLGSDLTGKEPLQIWVLFISKLGLEGPILIPVTSVKLPGKHQQIACAADLLVNTWSQLCSSQTLVSAPGKTRRSPAIQASLQFSLLLTGLSLLQHCDSESGKCLLKSPLEKDWTLAWSCVCWPSRWSACWGLSQTESPGCYFPS